MGVQPENGGDLHQHTFAPDVPATVAPFRAWRDLQIIVTKGPKQVTIESSRVYSEGRSGFKALDRFTCHGCRFTREYGAPSPPSQLMASKKSKSKDNTIAVNRQARHEYFIEDELETGMALEGWEVKSLRNGSLQLKESYVMVKNGEIWLIGAHISPLASASTHIKPDPTRTRKLLAHRGEIDRLVGLVDRKGYTLVALSAYWIRGRAKLKLGIARGKKAHDKRATVKDRDWKRDQARILKSS